MLLDTAELGDEVELVAQLGLLTIRPVHRPRSNWADLFATTAQHGDDTLLDETSTTHSLWDEEEREWS